MRDGVLRARVVPDDQAAQRLPGLATPRDRALTLVRDACSWDLGMSGVHLTIWAEGFSPITLTLSLVHPAASRSLQVSVIHASHVSMISSGSCSCHLIGMSGSTSVLRLIKRTQALGNIEETLFASVL